MAETAFAGGFGISADLMQMPSEGTLSCVQRLFSESASRLLVTVKADDAAAFEALFAGQPCGCIGEVVDEEKVTLTGNDGKVLISAGLDELKEAWQATLREM